MWKINNISGRSNHRKTWLLIHSVQKLWILSSIDNHLYDQARFLCFLQTPNFWKYIFGNIVQIKYGINRQKLTRESYFLNKQHYISFISDTFKSNTGWNLIQNNNNLRYQFLAPCQNLKKTNDPIPRKHPDREKDGHTLFCRTCWATAAGPINIVNKRIAQ